MTSKVTFHPFNKWCAVSIDGQPVGYMTNLKRDPQAELLTELHLKQDAPKWLRDVRSSGPWVSHTECQNAIRAAAVNVPAAPEVTPEDHMRALWSDMGLSKAFQDELLTDASVRAIHATVED